MPLDATPKSVTANSYCTRAEANTFLGEGRLNVLAWTSATDPNKDSALMWATRILDACWVWDGAPRTLTQALGWPRSGVRNRDRFWLDYDTIPEALKQATAELALELLKKDRTAEPELLGLGMTSLAAGSVRIAIDPNAVLPLIPNYLRHMIDFLGELKPGTGGGAFGTVGLVRT